MQANRLTHVLTLTLTLTLTLSVASFPITGPENTLRDQCRQTGLRMFLGKWLWKSHDIIVMNVYKRSLLFFNVFLDISNVLLFL